MGKDMDRRINWPRAIIFASSLWMSAVHADCAQPPEDPLEPFNRVTYYFNNVVDKLYIKPAMVTYDTLLPMPAKASVENFYNNIYTVITMVNDVLQFNLRCLVQDTARLAINSTLGLAGLFDVATPMGIQPHKSDLGETLYVWGWKKSAYFIVPIIGPSTIRDGLGLFGELWIWPPSYVKPRWRNPLYVMAVINRRYTSRDLEALIGVAGVENYELVRSGFMQNREFKLSGGQVPTQSDAGHDMLGEPPE